MALNLFVYYLLAVSACTRVSLVRCLVAEMTVVIGESYFEGIVSRNSGGSHVLEYLLGVMKALNLLF